MSRDNRSLLNSRSEAKRIYAQRQEIKRLEKENKILRENVEHNDKVVDKVNREINILKHNRDKAIEYIDDYLEREYFDDDILETNTIYNRDLFKVKNILKGDSE